MRLLTVPNWSFGRDRNLERRCVQLLQGYDLRIHYCHGDVDHNRTVTAFSGSPEDVRDGLLGLAELILPAVDLNHHIGVHPRVGGLDVCPIVIPPGEDVTAAMPRAQALVEELAEKLADRWDMPVFLYEKSERGRHEADLPSLRRGGFGGMLERDLSPDFGPSRCHRHLGVTIIGVRDFLLAFNVNLKEPDPRIAMRLAKEARRLRGEGDPRFLGVRALGFTLASRSLTQVSFNLSLPDITGADDVIEWVRKQKGVSMHSTELIGVIRQSDMLRATRLAVARGQVVD